MGTYILEYIWLDSNYQLRSKTKVFKTSSISENLIDVFPNGITMVHLPVKPLEIIAKSLSNHVHFIPTHSDIYQIVIWYYVTHTQENKTTLTY